MKTYKVGKYELTEDQFFGRVPIDGTLSLGKLRELPPGFTPKVGGDLWLQSLTELPEDFTPKVGGDLYLNSLRSIPADFAAKVGGRLFLDGLRELPRGFAPTVEGDLYLDGLRELPPGFAPKVGKSLWLNGLRELPAGFTPKVGGSLYLNGLRELPDGFAPTVGWNLCLQSLNELPASFAPTVGGSLYLGDVRALPAGFAQRVGGWIYQFIDFVNTLDSPSNHQLIESIVDGYISIFEGDMNNENMVFWHGGNLDAYDDYISQKNGRYEYGPGLYATTHYGTAVRYSKGSRKLYRIEIAKGNELNSAYLPIDQVIQFVNTYVVKTKRKDVMDRLLQYQKDNGVPAYIFSNVIVNEKAIRAVDSDKMRKFLVDNGIDYELVQNAFGWGETMIVLYNMKKIIKVDQIKSTDKIDVFDLPPIK